MTAKDTKTYICPYCGKRIESVSKPVCEHGKAKVNMKEWNRISHNYVGFKR